MFSTLLPSVQFTAMVCSYHPKDKHIIINENATTNTIKLFKVSIGREAELSLIYKEMELSLTKLAKVIIHNIQAFFNLLLSCSI